MRLQQPQKIKAPVQYTDISIRRYDDNVFTTVVLSFNHKTFLADLVKNVS